MRAFNLCNSILMVQWRRMKTNNLPFSILSSCTNSQQHDPIHQVIVSQSTNIFENLALEDWIFTKADLENTSYLLMWKNLPCVVVGRHQNIWVESNLAEVCRRGVDIARRKTGGGAVYHDEGNVNFSFITNRGRYDRKANLNFIVAALTSKWDIDLSVNNRDDLICDQVYKVSGTASRLAGGKAYHHFTLLLNVNTQNILSVLSSNLMGVSSRATASVPSKTINLQEVNPAMTYNNVVEQVAASFIHVKSQKLNCLEYIYPSTTIYPGIDKIIDEISSWKWIYGKSPKFSVCRRFLKMLDHSRIELNVQISITDGLMEAIDLNVLCGEDKTMRMEDTMAALSSLLVGQRFDVGDVDVVLDRFIHSQPSNTSQETYSTLLWVLACLRQCF